ncbi:MAG TPA: hypothetical protein DEV93_01590 [Chloroflexi bacterium]|jgi:hypothetical protein|nr:hypothetical protein [Chloroflexota bacterium]
MTEGALKIDLFDQFGRVAQALGSGRVLARQFLDASLAVDRPVESDDEQYMAIAREAHAGGRTLRENDG